MRISDWSSDVCSSDLMPRQFIEVSARAEHKDATVPAIVAVPQELLGRRGVGLLDEPLHLETTVELRAAADVAVSGFGSRRRDPERDQPVVLRDRKRAV